MIALALTAALAAPSLTAQAPDSVRELSKPIHTLKLGLRMIGSVVTLSDGRLIVIAPRDATILVVDPAGKSKPVALLGPDVRPTIPAVVGRAWPVGHDSTVIFGSTTAHWTILAGARIAATLDKTEPAVAIGRSVGGADTVGSILVRLGFDPGDDTVSIILVDRATGHTRTVTRVHDIEHVSPGRLQSLIPDNEIALLAPDGAIAAVHLDPYRIVWWSANGDSLAGPVLGTEPPVSKRDQKVVLKWLARGGREMSPDAVAWPATMTPIVNNGCPSLVAPGDLLVLCRTPTAAAPGTRYDLVNRRGVRMGQLKLKEDERIVDFGPNVVYVEKGKGFSEAQLEIYSWP